MVDVCLRQQFIERIGAEQQLMVRLLGVEYIILIELGNIGLGKNIIRMGDEMKGPDKQFDGDGSIQTESFVGNNPDVR